MTETVQPSPRTPRRRVAALRPLLATLVALVCIDLAVAGALALSERGVLPLRPLERYFDWGRSVPGKFAQWRDGKDGPGGNLLDAGWTGDTAALSAARFAEEPADMPPVVRDYGMSFSMHMLDAAQAHAPSLATDFHGGPGVPPNYGLATFRADAASRRTGDVATLAILASSVPAIFSLSNQTGGFEQPAPLTYPIYRPDGDGGLTAVIPRLQTASDVRAMLDDRALASAWLDQLRREDALFTQAAFAAPWLDASPFARLVRRSLAISAIASRKAAVLADPDRVTATLSAIAVTFAAEARAAGQQPLILLIQTRNPADYDLARRLRPVLDAAGVPSFATVDHIAPRDHRNFLPDSHYTHEANAVLGAALARRLAAETGAAVAASESQADRTARP